MSKKKIFKDIKEFELTSTEQAKYIPVLDKDPIYGARSIIKRKLEDYYKLLVETFDEIARDEIYHEILAHTILYSHENFMWYASFLKEVEKILDVENFEIPFNKIPGVTKLKLPRVYQPFYAVLRKNKVHIYNYKNIPKGLHPINGYRLRYILENFEMSDFIDDAYPSWYLLQDTTVFEQYSEKTNTRVRIDFRGGEFFYFIAGASDNWKMITDVPQDMDHVISALLFKNQAEV